MSTFTHTYDRETYVLHQSKPLEKPDVVLGKLAEMLGSDYNVSVEPDRSHVARLYAGQVGPWVRFEE